MLYYMGEVITRNYSKSKIFGLNLYPLPELKLDYQYIYDSEVCAVLTESDSTQNLDKFSIALNDQLNLGIFGLSIGYLPTVDLKGVHVDKLADKWMINIDVDKATLGIMTQLVNISSDNPSLSQRVKTNDFIL